MVRRAGFENSSELVVEILHGEGGDDSKAFTLTLREIYEKYAAANRLRVEILTDDIGHHVLKIVGLGAGRIFAGEAGKHCVQRIPPNDKNGRRQTSFVNVAVLPLPPVNTTAALPANELEIKFQPGKKGPGGQHKNKTASAVRMKHRPTGLSVFIDGRDQHRNKAEALRILSAKVNSVRQRQIHGDYQEKKALQLDDRGRGGKVRTYNFLEGYCADHRTGKRTQNIKGILKGQLDLIL